MVKVLANDGLAPKGQEMLKEKGFEIDDEKIPQDELDDKLDQFDAAVVRSATKIRKPLIEKLSNLKFIGRAGVGLDNIDVKEAEEHGITVVNTPAASSRSVAELVFAHLLTMIRHLYDSNRQMPEKGNQEFKALKKQYKGRELRHRTLGIIGLGRIGQEVARIAFGMGMDVLAFDVVDKEVEIDFQVNGNSFKIPVSTVDKEKVLRESDFLTLHVPFQEGDPPVIGSEEFKQMKDEVGIVNCARGGAVSEGALLEALEQGKVAYAGLDVFENEPEVNSKILQHPRVSLTPHIGAATEEAQQRIGIEMAEKLIDFFSER